MGSYPSVTKFSNATTIWRFLDHRALLHATFWDWRDDLVLAPLRARYAMFSPAVAEAEAAIGSDALVPKVIAEGWDRLLAIAPRAATAVLPLLEDHYLLVTVLERMPHAFGHGD
jgi:hypothetical protein